MVTCLNNPPGKKVVARAAPFVGQAFRVVFSAAKQLLILTIFCR